MTKRIRVNRVTKRTKRNPKEREKIRVARERFQRERPSLKKLIADKDVDGAMPWGDFLALRDACRALKRLRERRGLSLSEVAATSGIDKAALSRLENGAQKNPTMNTLYRYARTIGVKLTISIKKSK